MQGTVLALFGVALAAGIAELLLPDTQAGSAKLFRFLLSLLILLLLLAPFTGLLQEGEMLFLDELAYEEHQLSDFEQIFSDTINAQNKKEFEQGLLALLEREYGIPSKNVTLLVRLDAQGELVGISVFLCGTSLLQNPDSLEKSLSKLLDCTVEVR